MRVKKSYPPRECAHCGATFTPKVGNQNYCEAHAWGTPANRAQDAARKRAKRARHAAESDRPRDPEKLREYRRNYALRKRAEKALPLFKVCPCGAEFPIEFNVKGQMTTRKWCHACKESAGNRNPGYLLRLAALPDFSHALRCRECDALVGLEWGTVTGLDGNGRCPSCAAWEVKRRKKAAREQAGLEMRGGLWMRKRKTPYD